jgi:hypothetical protein
MSGKLGGAAGAILAPEIIDNGALSKLIFGGDYGARSATLEVDGGKALAEGLKGNQVIKELNFSGNILGYNSNDDTGTSGIIAIADVIPGMGALNKLDISNNIIEQGETLQQIIEYCDTKGIELDNHESESGGD